MKHLVIIFGLCVGSQLLCSTASGQVYSSDARSGTMHFIYQVKHIDEFFERFNNDTTSFLRDVYRAHHLKYNAVRASLIRTLFNYETKAWDTTEINAFVGAMTNRKRPLNIDFFGDDWFAELNCRFQYQKRLMTIPLILRVITYPDHSSKWVIASVGAIKLPAVSEFPMPAPQTPLKCISPTSHTTNFVSLHRAFEDKGNLADYFDETFLEHPNAAPFFDAVASGELRFLYVRNIKYHFFQTGKWIFRVEYFPRDAVNSGWLISSIKQVTPAEREQYERKLLGY